MKKNTVILLMLGIFFGACQQDDPVVPQQQLPESLKGVYIVNEGGFGKSNSSLSFFVPDSGKLYQDVFFAANGRVLGDIANDLVLYKDKGYIVVNNSNKIEVISTVTHGSLNTIPLPGNSPYKLALYNDEKAYVTNYYKGSVTVFNPTTYQVLKEIPVGQNPKGIAIHGNKIYVCNSGDFSKDSTVSVINAVTDAVQQTIVVGYGPNDVAVDSDGEIVVRCYGYADWSNPSNDISGKIVFINPLSGNIVTSVELPMQIYGHPGKMALSNSGYGYVITDAKIIKIDTRNHVVLPTYINKEFAYSVAINNLNGDIYVSDAKDFVQSGVVAIYDKLGMLKESVTVGIIPGTIVFK